MKRERMRGDGSLILVAGSKNFQARYYVNGRKVSVSTGTSNRDEALRFLAAEVKRTRVQGLTPLSDARKVTYGELRRALLANYIEKGNKSLRTDANGTDYVCGLPVLDDFFHFSESHDGPSAVTITTDTARQFVRKRQDAGVGNAAINRSLALLRRMMKLAVQESKLQNVPVIHLLKEPSARQGFITREQFAVLAANLPSHLRPLITFLFWCGCRVGEACSIQWDQVDIKRRMIRLHESQTKTSEGRIIPLTSELVAMLEDLPGKREGRVFDSTNLRKSWMTACAAAGLGEKIEVKGKPYDPRYVGLTIHDLRRSAIRNLRDANVAETVAMKISGHKTHSTFTRYNIASEDDLRAAIDAVAVKALRDSDTKNLLSQGNGSRTGKVLNGRKSNTSRNPRKH